MRQIPRLREMLDEADSPELHAILAEMKVMHPLKERRMTKVPPPKRMGSQRPHFDTEVIYLHDGDIDHYLTSGSYYGVAHHVTRWLHAFGYRAGMGIKAADLALDAYTLDCGMCPRMLAAAHVKRDQERRKPSPGIEIGQVAYDPKTGKDRRLLRRAERGMFAGFEVWAVDDCVASAGSPVPWDPDRVWPWVVHIDTLVPCRDDGRPIKVTFSMPASGPPGSLEWQVAELAAVKRAGIHEAMESFGFDPHALGGDVAECPVQRQKEPQPPAPGTEATLGGTEAERLQQLQEAARDARDWLAEALNRRANGGDVDEVLELAHGRLEALNLGDGDPDATTDHAHPDDSAGADEDRVAALERAIVEAVGLLACHDLHGDETALAARQAFEGLGIPGLEMVSRCSACAEPIEGELERCPDCGISLANGNLITGLEATGAEEDGGDV